MSDLKEKQESLSWKDTNIGGIGSKEDIELRTKAANTVEAWKGVGEKPELRVWRVEKFEIKDWPKDKYGSFYDGDSYIVLKSYETDSGKLAYDVHFWLGRDSTTDEKGTAAYMTVTLDDKLGRLPTQHREVQDKESDKFVSYFKDGINVMKGGIESGFNKVKPQEYKPKLLQVKGKNHIRVRQVVLSGESLNSGDVFILDNGLTIFQWEGKDASRAEKYTGSCVARNIRSDRGGKPEIVHLDEDGDDKFWEILGGKPDSIKSSEEGGDDRAAQNNDPNELWVLSDESGELEFKKVATGVLKKEHLKSDDVCIVDVGSKIYAWVGKGSNQNERANAIVYAMGYAEQKGKDETEIERVIEGSEPSYFLSFFAQS